MASEDLPFTFVTLAVVILIVAALIPVVTQTLPATVILEFGVFVPTPKKFVATLKIKLFVPFAAPSTLATRIAVFGAAIVPLPPPAAVNETFAFPLSPETTETVTVDVLTKLMFAVLT